MQSENQEWRLEIDVRRTGFFMPPGRWAPDGSAAPQAARSRERSAPRARSSRSPHRARAASSASGKNRGGEAEDDSGEGDPWPAANPLERSPHLVPRASKNPAFGQSELGESRPQVNVSRVESMWTVKEVAALLIKSTRWVYNETAAPPGDPLRIPFIRIGGNLRFDPPSVIAWAKAGVPSRSSRSRRRDPTPPDHE